MGKFDLKKAFEGYKEKIKNINIQDLKQKAKEIKRHNWCLVIVGIVMIILGISSMFHSDKTILSIVMFVGCGLIISGISHFFAYKLYNNDSADHPRWFLPQGVFEVILGFILVANLAVTSLSFPLMIAFWALFDGVMRITASYQLKKSSFEKWCVLIAPGIISLLLAFVLLAHPFATVISAPFLIGVTLFVWGITVIYEAFKLYD